MSLQFEFEISHEKRLSPVLCTKLTNAKQDFNIDFNIYKIRILKSRTRYWIGLNGFCWIHFILSQYHEKRVCKMNLKSVTKGVVIIGLINGRETEFQH